MGLRVLPEARPDDGRRRVRAAREVRRHLPRRDRRADGARSHRRLATCCCRSGSASTSTSTCGRCGCCPGLTSPLANRGAGRHRHGLRPRELRGRVLGRRRPRARRHAARGRRADGRLHAPRASSASSATHSRSRRSGRGRCSRARPSRTRCGTRWCCGTRWPRSVAQGLPDGRVPEVPRRRASRRAWSRIRRRSTSSSRRTCSATS